MDYGAFTDASLKMMYEAVRGALQADDAFEANDEEPKFRVRTTPEWKRHAGSLEAAMRSIAGSARSMGVEVIG